MNPRALMLTVAAGLAGLVAYAGLVHRYDPDHEIPVSRAVAERDLRFEDINGGDIKVWDARTGELIQTVTGQAGFMRATMRGLAQTRLRTDDDQKTPFRLTAWADGRLTLDDPVTTRHLELEAFGQTNEGAFAQLLLRKEQGG